MTTRFYSSTLGVVNAAIAAAAPGGKRVACANAASADIGSGWRLLIERSGTTYFSGTFTGALPVVGSAIVVSAQQATVVETNAAMALTGTITISIEKASDSTKGFSGSATASGGGGDAIISTALDGTKNPTFSITINFNNIADSTTAPGSGDSRVRLWVSPLLSNNRLYQRFEWLAIQNWSDGNDIDVNDVPDNYFDSSTGQARLTRENDPVRGIPYRAFRMRTGDGFTARNDGTYRSAYATPWSKSSPDGSMVCEFGKTYWCAWAFKLEADMFPATAGNPDLETNVVDFHHTGNSTGGSQTPFCTFVTATGYRVTRRYNESDDGGGGGVVDTDVYTDTSQDSSNWHFFVAKFKPHWDPAESPITQLWRQIGTSGTLTQILNISGPNVYKNTVGADDFVAPKFGVYRWADVWSGANTRTLFHKGFYMLEDLAGTPTLNESSMLAILLGV